METHELEQNLVIAVDGLNISSLPNQSNKDILSCSKTLNTEVVHDYAEIYTPSSEKVPFWLKSCSSKVETTENFVNTKINENELENLQFLKNLIPRPPTPPIHRFPSWEAKIYQVANDGLKKFINEEPDNSTIFKSDFSADPLTQINKDHELEQSTVKGFYEINIPVYATVKGRASQIRSTPFTGDSSDDSSEGEEQVNIATFNSQNSSATENADASVSRSSSSPSKSLKTSSCVSPAKKNDIMTTRITRHRETSIESGISDDYALPPDADSETIFLESTLPSSMIRASYTESPNKKLEFQEKAGNLTKLGGKLKTWRKRWFILKNGQLNYWKSQNDVNRKPQGQIVLDELCRISKADGASTFEIDTGKKIYYLTADSNATMDDWIRILQNVQKKNATKLLLNKEDQKPSVQGWVTKVKNGHPKKCWCILLGKMLLYYKNSEEANHLGQINMRDTRVEEVEHISDSDSDEHDELSFNQASLTVAIYPINAGPTYLILNSKQERDNWLYHLTIVSGSTTTSGTQYEQLIQKLMEADGDPNCVIWRHPILLHSKDSITSPLSSLQSHHLQSEAIKLFKSCQLFISVAVNQPGIDYHVVLAQNALQKCLEIPELQSELFCTLVKQTSRHTSQKLSVGVHVNKKLGKQVRTSSATPVIDCKTNPAQFTFIQGWQLLSLAVSLFAPKKSRLLWYLKLHIIRNSESKTETGKYAAYCERALERTLTKGGRETKPSRMEVLSILLKNPYHHSLPHAIPVHMMNNTYQVISFDGSSTIDEFHSTHVQEIGCRDSSNGFCLFSDDPIEKDLEHYLDPAAKLCDVISKWESALREKGSGKFENSRVIQITYKNRLYWKQSAKIETDKEKLLLCYQANQQIIQGRFPLTRDLALELASLMSQIDMGDYSSEKSKGLGNMNSSVHALGKFFPYRYRDMMTSEQLKEIQELLVSKWILLKGRTTLECIRIYLNCCRKWIFYGASLFQAKPRHSDHAMTWLAVSEDALSVLELTSMAPIARYSYSSVVTFGGCQEDFMLVVGSDENCKTILNEQKLLFAMSKPKILEITLLIADYMNALGQTLPGTPHMSSLTRDGSHRTPRSRPLQSYAPSNVALTNESPTAINTLNSQISHTLNSQHPNKISFSQFYINSSNGLNYNSAISLQCGQPDILKSTPDHQKHL